MFSWMVWVATLLFFGKDFQLNASLIISFLCFLTIRTNNEPPTKQWCQTCIFRSSIVDTKRAVYSSTLTNQRASLDGQSLTILLEKVVLSTRKLQLPKRNMEPQNHLFWKGTYIFQMGFHVSFPRSMGFWIIKRNTVLKVSFLRLVIQIHPNQGTVHQQLLTGSEGKLFFFQPRGRTGRWVLRSHISGHAIFWMEGVYLISWNINLSPKLFHPFETGNKHLQVCQEMVARISRSQGWMSVILSSRWLGLF